MTRRHTVGISLKEAGVRIDFENLKPRLFRFTIVVTDDNLSLSIVNGDIFHRNTEPLFMEYKYPKERFTKINLETRELIMYEYIFTPKEKIDRVKAIFDKRYTVTYMPLEEFFINQKDHEHFDIVDEVIEEFLEGDHLYYAKLNENKYFNKLKKILEENKEEFKNERSKRYNQ